MKQKTVFLIRLILGFLFILSAYSKFIAPGLIEIILVDHGMAASRETAAVIVKALIGFEFALGFLFLQPYSLKRIVIPIAFLFLAAFTLYLAYTGFILKDVQNCGCFGEMIKMSPIESITKNIAMIAALFLLFKWSEERKNYFIIPIVILISIAAVFISLPVKSQKDFKFAQYTNFAGYGRVDLSRGDKLIAIFNTECDHCQQLAADLTKMEKSETHLPEIYTLMFTEGKVSADSFKTITRSDFPYRMIGLNEFFNLIGQSPPRIYWLKDGAVKEIWDEDIFKNIKKNFTDAKK